MTLMKAQWSCYRWPRLPKWWCPLTNWARLLCSRINGIWHWGSRGQHCCNRQGHGESNHRSMNGSYRLWRIETSHESNAHPWSSRNSLEQLPQPILDPIPDTIWKVVQHIDHTDLVKWAVQSEHHKGTPRTHIQRKFGLRRDTVEKYITW